MTRVIPEYRTVLPSRLGPLHLSASLRFTGPPNDLPPTVQLPSNYTHTVTIGVFLFSLFLFFFSYSFSTHLISFVHPFLKERVQSSYFFFFKSFCLALPPTT